MVLADRTAENVRNGRRSRGPSPNGHSVVLAAGGITESSSDDENSRKNGNSSKATKTKSEYEEKIRVGRDYQAVCPELIAVTERKPELLNDRALLVWSPTKEIPDSKLEEYINVAKEKYGYNGEQALGMLFWHKHDLERAVLDLANFTPFPDEWTVEDKVLFEQAFQFHGKSFHRIRQMLPDKSIASLVKFYYSWKKTRSRTSVMDRQEKMKKNDSSENGSDHGSNEDSDNDEKQSAAGTGTNPATNTATTTSCSTGSTTGGNAVTATANTNGPMPSDPSEVKPPPAETEGAADSAATNPNSSSTPSTLNCSGCGVTCSELNATPQGKLCGSCYHHWRRTGVLRPTSGPTFMNKRARNSNLLGKSGDSHKRRPPRGMYINHDDIVKLANSAQNNSNGGEVKPNDDLLAAMDREIVSLWSQVRQKIQLNKQAISRLKGQIEQYSELSRPADSLTARVSSRWNNEELMLAVQGVRKFGRDFQAIADTIGTKTEAQLRTFFVNYRRRYNLDNVLKEYEAEQKQLQEQINNNNNTSNSNNNDAIIINNSKEDDSTTSVSELESADTNSVPGDKVELQEDLRKSVGKKSATGAADNEIMEIDLVDDEIVNGKKSETGEALESVANATTGSGAASTSASHTTGSTTTASAAVDGGTPMEVDEQSSSSAKLSESTNSNSTLSLK